MRTLVISDLHLGSRLERDVLRRPAALERLCAELADVDRLVLLGDTVEMLEGRPRGALADAEPVLRAIGAAMGEDTEVILLPGNHDHALVRPWLRERRSAGKSVGLADRVPLRSNPDLQAMARWLKPARVQVRYPGVRLGEDIWAHHGHYLDRHLVRQPQVPAPAIPEDYERALGTSIAALGAVMAAALPPIIGEPIDRLAGIIRLAGVAALPIADALPGSGLLAPLSAGVLGYQFRRVGLPAMASVNARLGVAEANVLFGHLHRSGPRSRDEPGEWEADGRRLWNSGCWVYEPLLLAGASPPHPYWPGGALLIEDDVITPVGLLDDVDPRELR
ncbi:MAG: metallophosphoesterase [Solirubrobacterales bacterium]|nr:metallophosphoesterase [Solirubrobacterales bacterium]